MKSFKEIQQTIYVLTGDEINQTFRSVLEKMIKDDFGSAALIIPIVNVMFLKELERGENNENTYT